MRKLLYFGGLLVLFGILALVFRARRTQDLAPSANASQERAARIGELSSTKQESKSIGQQEHARSSVPEVTPLEQQYRWIIAAHPSLTNVYNTLTLLSLRDPFSTDLFSDVCLFISLRSAMSELIQSEEEDYASLVSRWAGKANADPSKVQALLRNHEKGRDRAIESYKRVMETLSRTYADRFTKRHSIDGDAAITQILALKLPRNLKMPVDMPCLGR